MFQVLKDITNRYKVLKKVKVHYRPGWDCHGMPIELKVLTDGKKLKKQLSPLEIREKGNEDFFYSRFQQDCHCN